MVEHHLVVLGVLHFVDSEVDFLEDVGEVSFVHTDSVVVVREVLREYVWVRKELEVLLYEPEEDVELVHSESSAVKGVQRDLVLNSYKSGLQGLILN